MKLERKTKILLGIATMWPPVYIFVFIFFILAMVLLSGGPGGPQPGLPVGFVLIFVLHFITILASLGLMVFYIIHVVKNEALKSDMKAVWIILFFFAGMFAQPVYWYLQIWKAAEDDVAQQLRPPAAASWAQADEVSESTRFDTSRPPDWR